MADKPDIIFYSKEIYISDQRERRIEAAEEAGETTYSLGDDDVEETKKTDDEEKAEDKEEETNFESVLITEEPKVVSVPSEPKMPTLEELANSDYIRNRFSIPIEIVLRKINVLL